MSKASEVVDFLSRRRCDWLPKVFPDGNLEKNYFQLGNANGDSGDSLNIRLNGGPGLQDFGGDWKGDDLNLLAAGLHTDIGGAIRWAQDNLGAPRSEPHRPHKGNRGLRQGSRHRP